MIDIFHKDSIKRLEALRNQIDDEETSDRLFDISRNLLVVMCDKDEWVVIDAINIIVDHVKTLKKHIRKRKDKNGRKRN